MAADVWVFCCTQSICTTAPTAISSVFDDIRFMVKYDT
jgi:hypothetical protein